MALPASQPSQQAYRARQSLLRVICLAGLNKPLKAPKHIGPYIALLHNEWPWMTLQCLFTGVKGHQWGGDLKTFSLPLLGWPYRERTAIWPRTGINRGCGDLECIINLWPWMTSQGFIPRVHRACVRAMRVAVVCWHGVQWLCIICGFVWVWPMSLEVAALWRVGKGVEVSQGRMGRRIMFVCE